MGPSRSQDARIYKPLINEMAQLMVPAPGKHGQVVLQGQSFARTDVPVESHWHWADRFHIEAKPKLM